MEEFEDLYSEELLETVVHHTVRVKEAAAAGMPVAALDPESRGAFDFHHLAREILDQEVELEVVALDHWSSLLHGPAVSQTGVRFEADFPQARTVRVTGTFCDWSTKGLPLNQRKDRLWECHLDLSRGEHQYRFIVDGAWLPDPHNNQTVANEFGGANSLVVVA